MGPWPGLHEQQQVKCQEEGKAPARAREPQLSSPPACELCLCQAAVLPLWVPFSTQLPSHLAEGLPALTSLCLQKHHTLLSLFIESRRGQCPLGSGTTEKGAGHRASMQISVAWPLFVSPSIHSHSQPPPDNPV